MYVGIYYVGERKGVAVFGVVDERTDVTLFEGTEAECEEFAVYLREVFCK